MSLEEIWSLDLLLKSDWCAHIRKSCLLDFLMKRELIDFELSLKILWMRVWWTLYLGLETWASYTKPAFEVLDLKNSFEASGLGCGNPRFSNAGVTTSALVYLALRILDAGLKPDYVQILRWLNSRLKFTTSTASVLQLLRSCFNRILTFWFFTSCRFWQFCIFTGLLREYFDERACSIGKHSGNQSSCSWARRIRAVNDIRQGLIGQDAPAMPQACHGHSGYGGGYGALAGHEKEDVSNKVSDPPFTNLTPRSDIDEKLMLIGWLSGGGDAH